jgi:putative sterol carrier protein
MWKEGSKVIFQVKVVERNVIAVSNAAVELNLLSPAPAQTSKPLFESPKIFAALESALASMSTSAKNGMTKKVNAIFSFEIKNTLGEIQNWFIDMKKGSVGSGTPPSADLVVSVLDSDFVLLASGKLNPQKAFATGKIKVKGNVMLATKLEPILLLATAGKAKI